MESVLEGSETKLSVIQNTSGTETEILNEEDKEATMATKSDLVYGIEERPPWLMTIMMAVQVICFKNLFIVSFLQISLSFLAK